MNGFDRWLQREYDDCRGLNSGIFRIIYASALLFYFLPKGLWISELNPAFFVPPFGVGYFVPGLPTTGLVYVWNFLLTLLGLLLLVGWRTRAVSLLLGFAYFVASVWTYSVGKVNHDLFFVAVPFVLAFSDWGESLSLDARRRRAMTAPGAMVATTRSWPFLFLAMIVCVGMFTAAIPKFDTGYFLLESQAVKSKVIGNIVFTGRESALAESLLRLDSKLFWESFDWMTVILESAFLIALIRLRYLRRLLPIAALFHVGIYYMMQIAFVPNIIAYCAFVNWRFLTAVSVRTVRDGNVNGRRESSDPNVDRQSSMLGEAHHPLLPSWVSAWACLPAAVALTAVYLVFPGPIEILRTLSYTYVFWPLVALASGVALWLQLRHVLGPRSA